MTSLNRKRIKVCRCQNYDLMFFIFYLVCNYSVEIFLGYIYINQDSFENGFFISKGSSFTLVFKRFPNVLSTLFYTYIFTVHAKMLFSNVSNVFKKLSFCRTKWHLSVDKSPKHRGKDVYPNVPGIV